MIPRKFFWLFDFLLLAFAFFIAHEVAPAVQAWFTPGGWLAHRWVQSAFVPPASAGPFPPIREFLWILLATVPGVTFFLELFGMYRKLPEKSVFRILVSCIFAICLALSLITLGLFAVKEISWSRLLFFLYGAIAAANLAIFRVSIRAWYLRRRALGFKIKNVMIVGSPSGLLKLADFFKALINSEYRVYGCIPVQNREGSAGSLEGVAEVKQMGEIQDLGNLLVHRPIHEVVVASSFATEPWLERVVKDCDYFGVGLRIVPELLLDRPPTDLRSPSSDVIHLPSVVLLPHRDLSEDDVFVKRLFDIVVSGVLLVLFAPVFLVIAIAIKLTTPRLTVFYPWRVVGKNGVEFTGFKFTTMVADADSKKADLMRYNEMTGPVFKIKNDPRVTPFGRFLRKFSLNELPQLWSVLIGDMSLVGPRPAGPHELVRYDFWHKRKLSVRSGITCLWQVRGRNAISDFDDWVKMDLEYIDNWSLWLDFKILLQTAWVVIRGSGS